MIVGADMVARLEKVPLLHDFTPEQLVQLAAVASVLEFEPDEHVLDQGARSRNLWIVLEGTCEVLRKPKQDAAPPVVLAEFEPGAHFGEMSFFHPAPHSASVRAKTQLRLLRIRREDYDALVSEDSHVAYKLAYNAIGALADRLRRMSDRVEELTGTPDAGAASEWSRFRGKLFDGWNL
jgi:CRP/FNR family transcriptional regulator, cyclic AMP receptor protein